MNRCTRFVSKFGTVSALASFALLSGCGMEGAGYRFNSSGNGWTSVGGSGSSVATIGSSGVTSVRVDAIGTNYASITVKANSRLRVRFTPGINNKTIAGTGYNPSYGRLQAQIAVSRAPYIGSEHHLTGFLSNGKDSAVESVVIDLSSDLVGTAECPKAKGSSCRNTHTLYVQNPTYDLCVFRGGWSGCNENPVYSTHPWNAKLQIETDDTGAL